MANRMKAYERNAAAYERRWKTAYEQGNTAEMYTASQDYKRNIEAQERELKTMDPQSKEYEKAQESIQAQRGTSFEMSNNERIQCSGGSKQHAYEELEAKNTQISHDMGKAVERGDVSSYESLRAQYERNVDAQDQLGREMREEGIQYYDTGRQSKQDIYGHDCDMRDKLNEKVASREEKGKSVKEEDRSNAEKYKQQVKQDEVELTKYNGDRTVESMYERGASQEEIAAQKQKNEESVQSVERMNR